jgi:predicted porin
VTGATTDESLLSITDGARTTNRWGLRGSEDLGGGLRANFTLEGQYASDIGGGPGSGTPANQGLFQRKSIVGLSGGAWSVDLGRDYTVNFKTQGIYDPMSYTYTGITPTAGTNTAGVRFSNLVTAGFRFGTGGIRVDWTQGAELPDDDTGRGYGINGDFAFGPVTVGAAFSTIDANNVGDSIDTTNLGVAYKMGAFTFRGGWSSTEIEALGSKTETPMFVLGVQYAFSPTLNGRVGYYNLEAEVAGVTVGERKQVLVALDYYLSKRTTLYVMYDRLDLASDFGDAAVSLGGAQSGFLRDGASGISAGIAHSF